MSHTLPISPGVGRENDLYIKLQHGHDRWYPQVSPGFFFLGGQEFYLYSNKVEETVPYSAGLTNYSSFVTNVDFKVASKAGPVRMNTPDGPLIRISNNLHCFVAVTPTGATEVMSADIPTNSEVEQVTSYSGTTMRAVFSEEALAQSTNTYLLDTSAGTISVARAVSGADRTDPIYLTTRGEEPSLQLSEIRLVDSDGKVRTSYGNVANFSTYVPTLTLPGTGTVTVSTVADNVLTPASGIAEGTPVAIDYWIDGSFILLFSGSIAAPVPYVSILSSTSGTAILELESGSQNSYLDLQNTSSSGDVSLNPIYTGTEGGFVYVAPDLPEGYGLGQVEVWAAPDFVLHGQQVRIKLTASTEDKTHLSNIPYEISVTKGVTTYTTRPDVHPGFTAGLTDTRGNGYALWEPEDGLDPGTYTVVGTCYNSDGEVVSGSASVEVVESLAMTDVANDPKIHLYLGSTKDLYGFLDLYAFVADQSGIPYLQDYTVTVSCIQGRLLHNQDITSTETSGVKTITLDPLNTQDFRGAMTVSCKYQPVAGDSIIAQVRREFGSQFIYTFESTPLEVKG